MANFADWLDVVLRIVGCAERMAGTTRLELATSAVTVSGFQVLSTTWKSTDGSASHWKYIIGNVIVYRRVYRGSTTSSASDGVSSQNFSFTAPPSGNTEFDVLASGRAVICSSKSSISFGDIGPSSPSRPSTNRRRGRALNERIVKNDILWHRHRRRSH